MKKMSEERGRRSTRDSTTHWKFYDDRDIINSNKTKWCRWLEHSDPSLYLRSSRTTFSCWDSDRKEKEEQGLHSRWTRRRLTVPNWEILVRSCRTCPVSSGARSQLDICLCQNKNEPLNCEWCKSCLLLDLQIYLFRPVFVFALSESLVVNHLLWQGETRHWTSPLSGSALVWARFIHTSMGPGILQISIAFRGLKLGIWIGAWEIFLDWSRQSVTFFKSTAETDTDGQQRQIYHLHISRTVFCPAAQVYIIHWHLVLFFYHLGNIWFNFYGLSSISVTRPRCFFKMNGWKIPIWS